VPGRSTRWPAVVGSVLLIALVSVGTLAALGGVVKNAAGRVPPVAVGVGIVGAAVVAALGYFAFAWGRRNAARSSTTGVRWSAAVVLVAVVAAVLTALLSKHSIWSVVVGMPLALIVILCASYTAGRSRGSVFGMPVGAYRITAVLAAPLSAWWVWYMLAGPGYYAEFNQIKAQLGQMPGVEIVKMGGNTDLTFEDIWAHLKVEGKGEIRLMSLTRDSLTNSSDLHVAQIGPYSFRKEWWGYGAVIDREGKPVRYQSIGMTLNLGRSGEFSPQGKFFGKLRAPVRNVADVVQHYDEICGALASLQDRPHHFENADGSTVEYTIRTGTTSRRRRRE
jgi:hypothetical protein